VRIVITERIVNRKEPFDCAQVEPVRTRKSKEPAGTPAVRKAKAGHAPRSGFYLKRRVRERVPPPVVAMTRFIAMIMIS
jgi:hypothetical protein